MWSRYADTLRAACSRTSRISFCLYGGAYEGIPKAGIEVKAWSEKCLAKCVAVARGEDTYF